jgi:hypothetical protein
MALAIGVAVSHIDGKCGGDALRAYDQFSGTSV